jgi:uncharacterized protein GlcG (DUF336 family)
MTPKLDLKTAQAMIDAALAHAADMDVRIAVAVCDAGGHLLALARDEGCMILAAETVQAKARTAVYFRRPTTETVERSRNHPTVYGSFVENSAAPLVMSMGGFPLWAGDELVGGIGAAGGTGAEDEQISAAGLAVWEARAGAG